MKFTELYESLMNEAMHPDLKELLSIYLLNDPWGNITANVFNSYNSSNLSDKFDKDLQAFVNKNTTKQVKNFLLQVKDPYNKGKDYAVLPNPMIKFITTWLRQNDSENVWLARYDKLAGTKDERTSLKDVKATELYQRLKYVLDYLKRNHKVWYGENYYGEKQKKVKMAPKYKEWHDLLVNYMRHGLNDSVKAEVDRAYRDVIHSNYGRTVRDFVGGLAFSRIGSLKKNFEKELKQK